MARYIVDSQIDNHEKYYFIREQESQDIVLLPSKYRKGQILRSTPNTAPLICGAYNTQPEGLLTTA